ncbi:MAG: ATP-binding protein, partial [Planctomycetota bacterium]
PAILDDYGLDSALSRYVADMAATSGVAIDYQYSSPPGFGRLPSRIEVALYRIVQEAVTNIVSHAHAPRASVVVLLQHTGVTLVVEDNGQGFDAALAPRSRCLGLTGMKERASLLGGDCTIETKPGAGTTLRVTIPLGTADVPPAELRASEPRA